MKVVGASEVSNGGVDKRDWLVCAVQCRIELETGSLESNREWWLYSEEKGLYRKSVKDSANKTMSKSGSRSHHRPINHHMQ